MLKPATIIAVFALYLLPSGPRLASAADWKPTTLPSHDTAAIAGPTWYRCYIRVPAKMVTPAEKDLWRDSMTLNLGGIHGPFVVYLNGQKIAEADEAPDGPRRRFKIPKGILEKNVFNALAIRLDARAAASGIGEYPIFAGYHDEMALDGAWEVFAGDVDPASLKAIATQPATAFYIETAFKPASSALGRNPDLMPGLRVPPKEALAKMQAADGLVVELVESEPVVAQPTQINFDEHGRMWVAQYRQYPFPAGLKMLSRDMYYRARFDKVPPAPPHQDKGADIITVHESTKNDGIFDKHSIALDGLNMAESAIYGHGGIWVMNSPYLLFYPCADGSIKPTGDPEVRLAGFGLEDTHSAANGLTWGPDGWLYGCQGSTVTSRIVRPGIDPPNAPGVYFEACMAWRYHPEKKIYEIFAQGGGNNFGLDFDAEGRLYCGHNGGITHGWYFVQGGIYLKQGENNGKYGPSANPYTFKTLPELKSRNAIPRFTHNIVMFEGTALPSQYVGRLFGADPLHNCLTASERYPLGATFETSDNPRPLTSGDFTFRPVYLTNAPDGALYIADFCEEYIAHGQNYQGQIDPTSGRIYRLRGKDMPLNKDVDLASKTTAQLIETLHNPNRWHRQTAVRVLGQRHDMTAVEPLKALLKQPDLHPALEALWALHQLGALDETTAVAALDHPAAMVRAWAVRLMGDSGELPENFAAALLKHISAETDPEARCQIAATSRRLSAKQGLAIVAELLRYSAGDAESTPLLCWWTIESHCDADRESVLALLNDKTAWDLPAMKEPILSFLMRRFAAKGSHADYLACARLLETAPSDAHRKILLGGFEAAFKGRAMAALPEELIRSLAKSGGGSPLLRVRLGDADAIAAALKLAGDPKAKPEDRLTSTILFGEVKTPAAAPVLLAIAKQDGSAELRKAALTALLLYDDETIGTQVAAFQASLPTEVRSAAMSLLASRPAWSMALLKLIESGAIKPAEVPAEIANRLRSQEDPAASALAQKLLPIAKTPPKTERMAEVNRVRRIIESGAGDPYKGQPIFMQRCATCHTLFFTGGKIGPNLTAYQRDDLGTMLISIVDPSAEIREGYQNFMLKTKDGRILSGFLSDNDPQVVALRGLDGQDVRVPRSNIAALKAMPQSIMPEGLLDNLSDAELRDFFAFLRIPQPISK